MSDNISSDAIEHRIHLRDAERTSQVGADTDRVEDPAQEPASPAILLNPNLSHRVNAPARSAAMQSVQRTYGNRAVQRVVQRMAQEGSSSAETEPVLPHPSPARTGPKSGRVSVQRAFWDGKDLENDFWGSKELLGKRWGGTADAASSAFWNVAGMIPAVGAVGTGIDLAKAGSSLALGDNKAARRFANDAEFSALGMIPGYGQGQGALAGGYDTSVAIGRAFGADPENETPLSGDLFNKIPSAFGDPRTVPVEDLPTEGGGPDGGVSAPTPSSGGGDAGGPNFTPAFPGPLAPELLDIQ